MYKANGMGKREIATEIERVQYKLVFSSGRKYGVTKSFMMIADAPRDQANIATNPDPKMQQAMIQPSHGVT
jgi:hypothetical protein